TTGTAVRTWDVATGKELPSLGGHQKWARSFAISRDNKTILTGGPDSFIQVWDWPSGKLRRRIELPRSNVGTMHVTSDGRRAVVDLFAESRQRIFDLQTGKDLTPETPGHGGQVHGVALTPDGKLVSSGADNR